MAIISEERMECYCKQNGIERTIERNRTLENENRMWWDNGKTGTRL